MTPDDESLSHLKQRHNYDSWRGINTLDEELFIWHFVLCGDEFPGWRALRIQALESPDSPPYITSIWQGPVEDKEQLLNLDVFECKSRLDAHQWLLERLGEFMSPLIERREDLEIGDIAFAGPGGTQILFARANLVVSLANGGADLVQVNDLATALDNRIIHRPDSTGLKVISEILPPDFALSDDSTSAPIAPGPLGSLVGKRWYKLFSASGEITSDGNRLHYTSATAGPHEVTTFSVACGGASG